MFCKNCGSELSENAKLCMNCGCSVQTKRNKTILIICSIIGAIIAIPLILWIIGMIMAISVIVD